MICVPQYWSGSGLIDHDNCSGLGQEGKPPLLLYAARVRLPVRFEQCLYYSLDGGKSFIEYAGNPVIPHRAQGSRDPRVFYHPSSESFCMVLYERRGFVFFRSDDGLAWKETGRLEGFFECPDLFPLSPPDAPEGRERWVLIDGDGSYLVGNFDGRIFSPQTERLKVEYGPNFYATQSWNDAPAGRRIQLAWMRGGRYPGQNFNQQMSFPCDLTLLKTADGLRLRRYPAAELEDALGEPCSPEEVSEAFVMDTHLKGDEVLRVSVYGRNLSIDPQSETITFGEQKVSVPLSGPLSLRILVDTASIELYFDEGRISYSACFLPLSGAEALRIEAGREVRIRPIRSV